MPLPNESNILNDNVQSIALADEIDELSNRLNKISINELSFVKNLEEWRNAAHEIIDKFCQLKSDEYEKRTKEEIDRLRETMNLLSSDHDAAEDYIHWVKETIQFIHQQLDELQQIQSKFSLLQIDHSIICFPPAISDLKHHLSPLKDLYSFSSTTLNFSAITTEKISTLSLKSLQETMKLPPDHWYSLSENETHLLITGKSSLFLIDHSLRIVKKKSFLQIGIKDICWSKILSRFILISPKEIFTLNENNFSLESCFISLIENNPWERGTSSETTLFLSTFGENPFLVEFSLFPSIHLNRRYQSTIICQQNEIINDIKSNQDSLGIIIDNGFTNESRFELRSIKSFQCIWSIHLGRGWGYRSSPLRNSDYWIVTDYYNQRLIYITNNGTIDKIENYSTKPFNVVPWSEDQILIRTVEGLNIHQCK